jgi:signal transduction histidine kinase/DNA-binding response OmpR family regulator
VFNLGYFENGNFKTQVSLHCVIQQPWWFRWWAFCLYSIGIAIFMRLFYVYVKVTTTANNKLMLEQNKSKQLEELYEAKLRFFTNISHDIRNPLTLITNPVNSLLAKTTIDAESRTLLTIMKRNTNQLLQLVNELLEFRKIEAGMVKLSFQPCNLVTMAQQIIDAFQNQAFQKNISLQCVSESAVLIANIEPRYFEKAIYNLLSNAFKFTPDFGHINIHVYKHTEHLWQGKFFKSKQEISFVAIEVSDSGKGIPTNLLDKIFERFYEGENSSGTESSGIGLSIVKSIVEQHGGFVKVENRNGAVFTLFVPFGDNSFITEQIDVENSSPQETEIVAASGYTKELKSQTVLIVEDNDDLRAYLDILLAKHYSTIKASNGKEAFDLALSISPDLILSDVMMPEMNGIDLCIKLKNSLETSHIPVILLTAKNLDDAQREGLQAGADDYLTKPFVDEILLLKITNILTTREQLCARFSIENKDISEIASTSADSQFMTKFMKIIEQEYADCEFSIEKIAELICLSRSQVYKKSIALTGKTPVDIIQEVRMQNALNLLKNTTLSISEIAYSVGYSDPRYFSARFKKMIGVIPSELRDKK